MNRILFILLFWPVAVFAQEETLSPEEFDSYSQGKTLFFSQHGRAYGVEQYLRGRKSIWSFANGTCVRGAWFEDNGLICFTYENNTVPQCWTFHKNGNRYSARVQGADPANDLMVIERNDDPIACLGPEVGV